MSALDELLLAIRTIQVAGADVALPPTTLKPTTLNFASGCTITYNPATQALDAVISGGGPAQFTPTLDPTSSPVTVGDSTVMAHNAGNADVKRAAKSTIAASPGPQGIVTIAAAPGGTPTVTVAGIVPATLVGDLGTGSAQRVIVDPVSGRPARIGLPRGSEAILGNTDAYGNITVAPGQHVGTTPRHVVNVCAAPYGAIGDGQKISGGTMASGANTVSGYPGGTFAASDVGKAALVTGQGNSGGTADMHTTITAVAGDGSGCTFAAHGAFGSLYHNQTVVWGSDNTTAIQAALDAAFAIGGHTAGLPWGLYLHTGQLRWKEGVNLQGDSCGDPDSANVGGAILMYIGSGNGHLVAPSTWESGDLGATPSMRTAWRDVQIASGSQDTLSGVTVSDCYYMLWENVFVWSTLQVAGVPVVYGYKTAAVISAPISNNTAFWTLTNCQILGGAGRGLYLDNTLAFTKVDMYGGALQGGTWGLESSIPGGGVGVSVVGLHGTDIETGGTGGVTGYFNGLEIDDCYFESATGPMLYIQGSQYAHSVHVHDCYISRWGGSFTAPIVVTTSAGCQGLHVHDNRSPFSAPDSFAPNARSMVSCAGAKRVQIGVNDSYMPTCDLRGTMGPTVDLGFTVRMYPCLVASPTASGDYAIQFDASGHLNGIFPGRKCAILGMRCFFNQQPTAGSWRALVTRANGVVGNLGSWTGSVMEITSGYSYPWTDVAGSQKVILLGTGTALDGVEFPIVGIDSTHFTLTGSTNVGSLSNFTIGQVVRDTGFITHSSPSAQSFECFTDSSGSNAYVLVEDQNMQTISGTQIEGVLATLQTDGSFAVPANTIFVMEIDLGYQSCNAAESVIA